MEKLPGMMPTCSPPHFATTTSFGVTGRLNLCCFLPSIDPVFKRNVACNVFIQAKPTVIVAEKLEEQGIELLRACTNVVCSYDMTHDELCTKISLCDVLIVRSETKVTRDVFELSKGRLKVVGSVGAGVDNIDLSAATEHGCLVVNAPTSNTVTAAELGIALLTSMARRIAQANASVKLGQWERSRFIGVSLTGKTIAIMGLGKIGYEVSLRAKSLGMNVIANDPYALPERARAIGVELVSFEEALSTADFISLHVPLTHATKNLFNDDAFSIMKKGVRIINIARGAIIDEEALLRALESGVVAQAALDVLTDEPTSVNQRLLQHENVTVTPHLSSIEGTREDASTKLAEAVLAALKGQLASTVINAPTLSSQVVSALSPYTTMAEKLASVATQLLATTRDINSARVTYASAREPGDVDTLLLRAMILKGIIEAISCVVINIINAEFFARQMGITLREEKIKLEGSLEKPLEFIEIKIGNVESKFRSSASETGEVIVVGDVKEGKGRLIRVGCFGCDVSLDGSIVLFRQADQPGIIGEVGCVLGSENVNVNFMSVRRYASEKFALMAIGVDEQPSCLALQRLGEIEAVQELVFLKL